MQFTQAHQTCPNNTKFTTITEKDYSLCLIHIYDNIKRSNSFSHQIQEKQCTFQLIIIQNYTLQRSNNKQFFPSIPHTYFSSKFITEHLPSLNYSKKPVKNKTHVPP